MYLHLYIYNQIIKKMKHFNKFFFDKVAINLPSDGSEFGLFSYQDQSFGYFCIFQLENFSDLLHHYHHRQVIVTLSIRPYHPSLSADLSNYILCPHRADVNKFLLVSQHWHIHVYVSIEQHW